MNRILTLVSICITLAAVSSHGEATGLFHIEEGRIIDPDGHDFIAHGVNSCGPRYWRTPVTAEDNAVLLADVWKVDALRLNWRVWENSGAHDENLPIDEYIENYLVKKNLVCMPTIHDYTGGSRVSGSFHDKVKEFWLGLIAKYGTHLYTDVPSDPAGNGYNMTKRQASYFWCNLRNEPIGGNSSSELKGLKAHYDDIIEAIRATGAENIITLDGSTYANEYKSTTFNKTYGEHYRDDYTNVAMSMHYGHSSWGVEEYGNYFTFFTDRKIALIVGENSRAAPGKGVGNTRGCWGYINYEWAKGGFQTHGAAYNYGIGCFYWHFHGGDGGKLTSGGGGRFIMGYEDGVPDNLTEEGKIIWADARRPDKGDEWKSGTEMNIVQHTPLAHRDNPVVISHGTVTDFFSRIDPSAAACYQIFDSRGRVIGSSAHARKYTAPHLLLFKEEKIQQQ
jgi:hypothetical protein